MKDMNLYHSVSTSLYTVLLSLIYEKHFNKIVININNNSILKIHKYNILYIKTIC